jgi:NitT/TauT family transport system permease protein
VRPVSVERDTIGGGVMTSSKPDPKEWPPLPQRRRPRRPSALLAIRTPISARSRWVLITLSFAIPLLLWLLLSELQIVSRTFLPTPGQAIAAGIDMIKSGQLWDDTWITVRRILYGFGLALVISLPLGFAIGSFVSARSLFEPIIGLVRYLPAVAFTPLLLIWLGVDEAPKIALLCIGTVFFNTMMVADVVKSVPMAMINVSYTLGARRGEVLRKVILPHSLPGIIDAIRVNIAAAWNFVVVAEVVSSTTGLGRRIMQAQRFLHTDEIFAMLIVIGLLGVLIDVALRLLRTSVGRWTA